MEAGMLMKIHHHPLPQDGTVFPFIFSLFSHSSADQMNLLGGREVLDCTTNTKLGLMSITVLYQICTTPDLISFLHIRTPNICFEMHRPWRLIDQLTDQSVALSLWEFGCIQQSLRDAVNTMTFKNTKDLRNRIRKSGQRKVNDKHRKRDGSTLSTKQEGILHECTFFLLGHFVKMFYLMYSHGKWTKLQSWLPLGNKHEQTNLRL